MRIAMLMLVTATLFAIAATASAQTMKAGSVTMVRTGWNADSFAIVTAEPIANPAGCATADGYISDKSLPGYATYYAAALAAVTTRKRVVITVHNSECFGGRPKLIGVNVTSE
ncbi:MAG: hypothetical protein P0Y66_12655 [Candidatus Kaistia colombiensis]|nr:MAG: hypothetical protein P0Y66_12655 [Kaistia sp.]